MYCLVSPFSNTFDTIWLHYYVPDHFCDDIKIWQIVEIPLREEIQIAVVLDIHCDIWDTPEEKIKSLISIKYAEIFLHLYQIKLLKFISQYYFTPIWNAANLFFPKNLLEKIKKDTFKNFETKNNYLYTDNIHVNFSPAQQIAFDKITWSENNKFLLYWITWSGKTQIYIELIKQQLQSNKQSLLLIPEIILSNQISQTIKNTFWDDVLILNSTVSAAKRTQYFSDIYTNKAKIIIGTRSALFYPFSDLWIIIVDEQHDNSFISDQSPRYHSLDVVNNIVDNTDIKLILASWTPSINAMYDSMKGKYELITLLEKYKTPNI